MRLFFLCTGFFLIINISTPVCAEIYQYTDEDGKTWYTNQPLDKHKETGVKVTGLGGETTKVQNKRRSNVTSRNKQRTQNVKKKKKKKKSTKKSKVKRKNSGKSKIQKLRSSYSKRKTKKRRPKQRKGSGY